MPQIRKPTAIKKILGNPGNVSKDKLEDTVKFNESEMDTFAPPDLVGKELEKWYELAPMLRDTGVFTQGDREMLALFCREWSVYIDAVEHTRRYGSYVAKGKDNDMVTSPWVGEARRSLIVLKDILGKFGMSPVDRAKATTVSKEKTADPKDRFFS